jgi:hypothetical protein
MNKKDQLIADAVSSLTDGFVLPEGQIKWARTGPMPDEPKGYKFIPAPADIQEMMNRRFEGGGGSLTAIAPEDPNKFLHGVENHWDGPYVVVRFETQIELEYVYVYYNPWTKDADVFNEFGYFSKRDGSFVPW